MRGKDITGKRFGRLTAVRPTSERDSTRSVIWVFKCDCGRIKKCASRNVVGKLIFSCGCMHDESIKVLYKLGVPARIDNLKDLSNIRIAMGIKYCGKCMQYKNIGSFYNKKTSFDGKRSPCKACTRSVVKSTYKGRLNTAKKTLANRTSLSSSDIPDEIAELKMYQMELNREIKKCKQQTQKS